MWKYLANIKKRAVQIFIRLNLSKIYWKIKHAIHKKRFSCQSIVLQKRILYVAKNTLRVNVNI